MALNVDELDKLFTDVAKDATDRLDAVAKGYDGHAVKAALSYVNTDSPQDKAVSLTAQNKAKRLRQLTTALSRGLVDDPIPVPAPAGK